MASQPHAFAGNLASAELIAEYVTSVLRDNNAELVEITFSRDGKDRVVELCVDTETVEGLSLDDIVSLSEELSALLDGKDMGTDPYILQVTSPGIERPLDKPHLWLRNRGHLVDITLQDGTTLSGRIGTVSDEDVAIVTAAPTKKGQPIKLKGIKVRVVAFEEVVNATVQIEFSQPSQLDWEIAQDDERIESLLTQKGTNK